MRNVLLSWVFLLIASPALALECWSGWGYRVAPDTLAFQGPRLHFVTDGPVRWEVGKPVSLYPIDERTGRRDPQRTPLVVRPRQPSFSFRHGKSSFNDVAALEGESVYLMMGATKMGPPEPETGRQRGFVRWACGLDDAPERP